MTNKNLLKILFVEDLPSDVDLAVLELRKEKLKFEHTTVCTRVDLIKALNEFKPDLIISDYMMPVFNGLQALKEVKEFNPEIPFILCTGSINEETAVECIKAGATDYIIKEHLTRLPFAVKEALEQHRIQIEKRAAELLLKESEEKLQSIFSAAPVGIGLVVIRVFMEVNDTFCKMTGYTRKELIGKNAEMIYATNEEYESVGIEKYRQIAEEGTGSVETRFKCKDGRILNIFLSLSPLDKDDLTKGVTFTAMDITKRKLAEETLRESEEKWRTLVTTIPEYIGLIDREGKFLFLNHYAEGFTEKDTIGKSHLDFIPNEWKEFYRQKFEKCISTLKNQIFEYTAFGDNKTLRTYETCLVPVIHQGKVSNVMAIARDITGRRQAEDKLKSSEERLKILFECAPDAYYMNDLKGNFIDGNIAAEKLMGYDKNELIGKSLLKLKLLSLSQLPRAAKLLVRNALGQGTGPDEFVLSRKDGSKVTVEIITHPVKIKDKTLVLGIARDITERKRAEDMLRESEMRYKTLFSNAAEGILVAKTETKQFLYANPALCKMFGYTEKEIMRLGVKDIHPKESLNYVLAEFEAQMQGEKTVASDLPCLRKDGTLFYADIISTIMVLDGIKCIVGFFINITERKLAEETIKVLARFPSENPDPVLRVDRKGQLLYANEVSFKLLTWKLEIGEKTPTFLQKIISEVLKEGTGKIIETEHYQKVFSFSIVPFVEEGYVNLYGRDITDRKKAEEVLRESESSLRNAQEIAKMGSWEWDLATQKTNWSDNYFAILGFKPTEIEPGFELFRNRIHPDDVHFLDEIHANIMKDKTPSSLELRLIQTDGTVKWIQNNIYPVIEDDKLVKLKGVIIDITELKRTEEDLQRSLAFSESLLKTIPFGMDIVDESGTVLFLSDSFKRIFSEDAIGEKCWEIYRDDKTQCNDCPLIRAINIGETKTYETQGVLGNRIFEINHTGIMYQSKKALLEIFQDITERKHSEEELINAKNKAEEGDRLKTAFLHNISHEIRTPMNAIVGFSTLLGEPDVDIQTRQSYIEVIMQSSNHLLSIITDIVDISNIEANLVKTVKSEINVNSTLKSLCNQFMLQTNEKKIQLVCETLLSDSDTFVLTDSTKLTQILSNLIGNALKFTDKGNIKVGIKLKDSFLEFSVSDTGIGIPEEYHKRIFDRFYQVQNTVSRLYEGTGLGLSISKAYVELLGGKIWVSSEPGKGTSFFFTIPFEKQIVETVSHKEKRSQESFVFPEKKKILVAEDIDSNFKLIQYFLSGTSTDILRAVNGKEAVEKCLSTENIDLVLMDIKMPVMDGYTAARLIRETNSEIPIIAQTAYADDRETAIECGCSGFISKPFDKKGLLKVISEFI